MFGVTQVPATTAPQPQLLLQVCVSVARPMPQAAHTRVLFFFCPGVHAAVTPPHAPHADQADHVQASLQVCVCDWLPVLHAPHACFADCDCPGEQAAVRSPAS